MRNSRAAASTVKTLRVDRGTAVTIERMKRRQGCSFSSLASEMLAEAARMRQCPGVLFADGPSGRRARIEGTGIEVWEVMGSYLALDRDERRLARAYPFLSSRQLRAALGYFEAYPEEIQAQVDANTTDDIFADLGFARRATR